MATMNISLPKSMKDYIQSQVGSGIYANTSDYIRDLIRQEQRKQQKLAHMQQAITQGIDSGAGKQSVNDIYKSVLNKANKNLHP